MIAVLEPQDVFQGLRAHYSQKFDSIHFLRKGGTSSYIVAAGDRKYFAKVIPAPFVDTARQSVDIMVYLAGNDFPVPQVILTADRSPYFWLNTTEGKCLCVVFRFIEGREPYFGEDIAQIGTLVGQLHTKMDGYKGELKKQDKPFFIDRYIHILSQKGYPEEKIAKFRTYGAELWNKVRNLPRGFCHGDLYRGNLLRTPAGNYFVLDFDTSCNAIPVYDIMVLCDSTDYFRFDKRGLLKSKTIYERFLNGYLSVRALTALELAAFYDLIAIRHYQLQATIIEIYGLDCVDEKFLDNQLDWLMRWRDQCANGHFGIQETPPLR